MPNPAGFMSRSAWKLPMVQDELVAWAARLTAAGIEHTPASLEEKLWLDFERLTEARKVVLRPLRPYYRWCGTTQSWPLFGIPQRYPSWLHIDIQHPGGPWETIYISRDPAAAWRREVFDTERYRSVMVFLSRPSSKRRFKRFGTWVGGMAAEDFPDAQTLRLRWRHGQTLLPRELARGKVASETLRQEITVSLEGLQ